MYRIVVPRSDGQTCIDDLKQGVFLKTGAWRGKTNSVWKRRKGGMSILDGEVATLIAKPRRA